MLDPFRYRMQCGAYRFKMKILSIIPAFDAEKSVGKVIDGLAKTFDLADILVIDDGSGDKTREIAVERGVRVIGHKKNSGKGAALKTGFKFAIENGYDAVLTIDADMQHPPELAKDFITEMEETDADIIIGDRLGDLSNMPIQRRFSNKTSTFLVHLWTGKRIPDLQCGYRLIKTWIIEKADLRTNFYQMETELVLEAARLGAKFSSVPIPTVYNEYESKMNEIGEVFRFIGIMIAHPFRVSKTK
ncbi:hypothetical protein DRQ36_03330 [bacterium]|nr:MAG: hypothetical protein DRQ36_03330 [bacterium]